MSLPSHHSKTPDFHSDFSSQHKSSEDERVDAACLQIEEENIELRAKLEKYQSGFMQSLGMLKEYRTLVNYFPIRGEHFCSGTIEKSSASTDTYSVRFPQPFPTAPNVVVCVLFPKIIKVNTRLNPVVSCDGFVFKVIPGVPVLADDMFYFWIASCPILPSSEKISDVVDKMTSAKVISEKDAETTISKYIKKYNVNDYDVNGKTLLYHVCAKGYANVVEMLLTKGADPNICDENQYSPLHVALHTDKIVMRIVELLLSKGADRLVKNERMKTPLHYLCQNKNLGQYIPVLKLLLDFDNKSEESQKMRQKYVNDASFEGDTALTLVCTNSLNDEAIKILCESGADVNHSVNNGAFPLYSAVNKGNVKLMELLIRYGGDIGKMYQKKPLSQVAEEKGHMEKLMEIIRVKYADSRMSDEQIKEMSETFDTIVFPVEQWTETLLMSKPILIDLESLPTKSHVENFFTCTTHKYENLLVNNVHDPQACTHYYSVFFRENDHTNYIINSENETIVVSISDEFSEKKMKRVIVRTKRFDTRKTYENKTDQQILKELFPDYKKKSAASVRGFPMYNALMNFEDFFIYNRYKFGVLYAGIGQTKEREFYNNRNGSEHFEKFLELLGTKTELFGFGGFAGGLDTKNRSMGKYCVSRRFSRDNIEIMFHVSTYMPLMENNEQQIGRKKHIGNDVVVLIFKEYSGVIEPIDVSSFKTQYSHCYIVVGCDVSQNNPPDKFQYSVNIWCKKEVAPVAPFITTDAYQHSEQFGEFLVAKMINAERAAQDSLTFRAKKLIVRQSRLEILSNSQPRL
ncbi:rap GTPase-activating protein, putative [Entamoeba invadens IP1]|uniref:Rap GTPase-activating protein, putative n=1 Tax=Entamoeba invadens IP1 TaxID=370355 RepID=L7FN97_ENTIV|nr:rap GTPase-activating protein, putative [Entamoeba invadens IP1]ELP91609.1 rap GTPase-activating protein, putative [Entamoeba invadens IP1]|eukprot:XP_004258380.1 rap GTPase-activating protein, putative [Entamoeba invadens IP1]